MLLLDHRLSEPGPSPRAGLAVFGVEFEGPAVVLDGGEPGHALARPAAQEQGLGVLRLALQGPVEGRQLAVGLGQPNAPVLRS